jgi:hypothetical protein
MSSVMLDDREGRLDTPRQRYDLYKARAYGQRPT